MKKALLLVTFLMGIVPVQAADNWNPKHLLAASIGAVTGAFGLWALYYNSTSPQKKSNDIPEAKPNGSIEHLTVMRQVGGATCGYHAVVNAFIIARNLLANRSIKKDLKDSAGIQQMITKDGEWRTAVIEQRKHAIMTDYLVSKISPFIQQETIYTAAYTQAMRNVLAIIAYEWLSLDDDQDQIDLAGSLIGIKRLFKQQRFERNQFAHAADPEEALEEAKNPATVDAEVDWNALNTLTFPLTKKLFYAAAAEYNQSSQAKNLAATELDGDWINDAECNLIAEKCKKMLPPNTIHTLNILDDAKSFIELNMLDETWKTLATNQQAVAIFALGTMSQQHTGSQGHWFSLVMHKDQAGIHSYTADSLGTSRVNDPSVKALINDYARFLQPASAAEDDAQEAEATGSTSSLDELD